MSDSAEIRRALAWEYGLFSVERRGAMLGPVLFLLPDGRQVAPLHVAPWFAEPQASSLPGLMPRLRGDWCCVPFGFDVDRPTFGNWSATSSAGAIDEGHGFGANHDWTFLARSAGAVEASIDYPIGHPIARLERRITPDPCGPALDVLLIVHPRRDCLLPVGLHPVFRLPLEPASLEIVLDPGTAVATFPGNLDVSSLLAPGCFATASTVPLRTGGVLDIRHLPFAHEAEDLVQILRAEGTVVLRNVAEGYAVRLTWDASHFPSFLLWLSNRGRQAEPWRGRHLALGVEPVASAFDLGAAVAAGSNPLNARGVRTAQQFRAGEAWTTRYRLEVSAAEASRA